jgi:hypothetical protein
LEAGVDEVALDSAFVGVDGREGGAVGRSDPRGICSLDTCEFDVQFLEFWIIVF